MATVTPRLNLPRPEPSDNVNLANHQALIDAIDNAAETPAGAQAKADAAEQAAKAYTDAEVGTRATKTEFNAHVSDNVRHITAAERNNWNAKETPAGAQAKADAALQAAKNWANAENVTTIPYRAASVPGSNYPVGVTAFEVSNGTADGWIVNQGTVLTIRLNHSYRMTQIFTHSTTNGLDTTYIRTWRSDVGWSDFKKIPMEHLSNTFTENQTIENSGYRYWGVRRGNNGAEIAVSSDGYAQLVKREGGNIVESISIRGAGDARVGNARIWHDDNLSSPARTNVDSNFTVTQTFNTPSTATGNWTVIRMKRDQNGVGDYGLSMRNDGRLSIWDYINQRTLILFGDDRVTVGAGVELNATDANGIKVANQPVWYAGNQGNPNNLNTSSKQIVGAINELFTTVSNGKQAIRDAIADAGGTPPSGSPDQYTHQDLAAAISTVRKHAKGSTPAQTNVQIRGINFDANVLTGDYQTSDDGFVAFTIIYFPEAGGFSRLFVNKSSTTAADPIITKVSGGFNITLDRPAGTSFDWEAWGGRP